jgi:hypothetical protein
MMRAEGVGNVEGKESRGMREREVEVERESDVLGKTRTQIHATLIINQL